MTTDQENRIREIVKESREIRNRLNLQEQELAAMLPEKKGACVARSKGYITMPDGEILWYDKKEEKKHNRAKSGLTLKIIKKQEVRQCQLK